MRILIADDEKVSRHKLGAILENVAECLLVENGREAVEAFKAGHESGAPFDMVMLDIRMPVMNGTQALKAIRELENEMALGKPDRAKVVMVTVYDDMTTVVSSFYNECDGYITKPFDKQRVMDELKRFGAA